MIKIIAAKIPDHIETSIYNDLLKYISRDKNERIGKFKKVKDAYRALLGDILTRIEICKRFRIKNQQIEFLNNPFGKPFLQNYFDFYFNVSHAGDWVVSIFDNEPVGIDIETIRPIELDIAKNFFSLEEYSDLIRKKEEERLEFFYDLWTLKESYIKAIGRGLSIPLDSFIIQKKDNEFLLLDQNKNRLPFYLNQYTIDENYKLSFCTCKRNVLFNVEVFTFFDLYQEIKNHR